MTFLSRLRNLFRRSRLLSAALIVLVVVLAVFLLRWPLFGGIVRGAAQRALEDSLGVRAEIGDLSGSLVWDVHCSRISARAADERAVVRSFRLENLAVHYNLWQLLLGDPAALSVRAEGGELVLDAGRTGIEGAKAEKGIEDFSLPAGLPGLELTLERVLVEKDGRALELDGFVLRMGGPDRGGSQQGSLEAAAAEFSSPEASGTWKGLRCPVLFHAQSRLAAGPLQIDEGGELARARAELEDGDPAKVSALIESGFFGGTVRLEAEASLEKGVPLRAGLKTADVDAASLGEWISRITEFDEPLWGSLSTAATLEGDLTGLSLDRLSLQAECRLENGGFAGIGPLDVVLEGGIRDGAVSVEQGRVDSGRSWIVLSEGSIPLRDGRLDMNAAAARFSFALAEAARWIELADIDAHDARTLVGARAEGEGRIAGRVVMGDRTRIMLEDGTISLANTWLSVLDEGLRLDIKSLEGSVREIDFSFLEPMRIDFLPDRMEVSTLHARIDESTVTLAGRLLRDRRAEFHVTAASVDRSLLSKLVPSIADIADLDWTKLDAQADLSGSLTAPSVDLECSIQSLRHSRNLEGDVDLNAHLRPGRFDLENLEITCSDAGRVRARAGWDIPESGLLNIPDDMEAFIDVESLDLARFKYLWPPLEGAQTSLSADVTLQGDPASPACTASAQMIVLRLPEEFAAHLSSGDEIHQESYWNMNLELAMADGTLAVGDLEISTSLGAARATGRIPLSMGLSSTGFRCNLDRQGPVQAEAECSGLDLARLAVSPALSGLLSLRGSLSGSLDDPAARFDVQGDGLVHGDLAPHDLSLGGILERGTVSVSGLELARGGARILGGDLSVDLDGTESSFLALPGPASAFTADLAMERVDVALYAALFDLPLEGLGTARLEGDGTLEDPRLEIDIALDEGAVDLTDEEVPAWARTGGPEIAVVPVSLRGNLILGKNDLEVTELHVESVSDARLEGAGRLPLGIGWNRIRSGKLLERDAPLDCSFRCSDLALEQWQRLLPGIRRASGLVSTDLRIKGSLARPVLEGRLSVSDGSFRIESRLPSLEEAEARLAFDGDTIVVERIDGKMGGGAVHAEGRIICKDFEPRSYDLRINGSDVLLQRSRGLRVRADLDVALSGPSETPLLSGEVTFVDTRFVRRITLIPESGPPRVEERVEPFSLGDPFGSRLVFDLALLTREKNAVRFDNNLLQGEAKLNLALKGTGRLPYFLGDATFNNMILKLPNFRFLIDSGRLSFPEDDPFAPQIFLTARGRRKSIDVDLLARGPLSDPEIIFSSSPPLRDDDVLVLITTGVLPEAILETGVGNEALVLVGSYLGQELIHELFGSETTESGESMADRFELSIGTEVGTDGTDNIMLEYNLKGPWYLQGERDIYSDANMGIVYRIRFQ